MSSLSVRCVDELFEGGEATKYSIHQSKGRVLYHSNSSSKRTELSKRKVVQIVLISLLVKIRVMHRRQKIYRWKKTLQKGVHIKGEHDGKKIILQGLEGGQGSGRK